MITIRYLFKPGLNGMYEGSDTENYERNHMTAQEQHEGNACHGCRGWGVWGSCIMVSLPRPPFPLSPLTYLSCYPPHSTASAAAKTTG